MTCNGGLRSLGLNSFRKPQLKNLGLLGHYKVLDFTVSYMERGVRLSNVHLKKKYVNSGSVKNFLNFESCILIYLMQGKDIRFASLRY